MSHCRAEIGFPRNVSERQPVGDPAQVMQKRARSVSRGFQQEGPAPGTPGLDGDTSKIPGDPLSYCEVRNFYLKLGPCQVCWLL